MDAPLEAGGHLPTPVSMMRRTRGGRSLRYSLTILQQPERARACGSGVKAASDRRPVDPPPVIELKIFEQLAHGERDVTFQYSANFFLFATLQHARATLPGRGQTSMATAAAPVLSGTPVSGMAYLDRPSEAGYFLYPDLSIRHEGLYRLNFHLYEENKDAADLDEHPQPAPFIAPDGAEAFPDCFYWRMEVQSDPFSVYSAKKFPGLTESTALSRMVAEQGCRVRIRRDVRLRRREPKQEAEAKNDALVQRAPIAPAPAAPAPAPTPQQMPSQLPPQPARRPSLGPQRLPSLSEVSNIHYQSNGVIEADSDTGFSHSHHMARLAAAPAHAGDKRSRPDHIPFAPPPAAAVKRHHLDEPASLPPVRAIAQPRTKPHRSAFVQLVAPTLEWRTAEGAYKSLPQNEFH